MMETDSMRPYEMPTGCYLSASRVVGRRLQSMIVIYSVEMKAADEPLGLPTGLPRVKQEYGGGERGV